MNMMRTGLLLAAMTALFLGIGYLIGGVTGAAIAFAVALAMNAFAYWNSDKMVLRMYNAQQVTREAMPGFYGIVEQLAARAEVPMPKVFVIENDQPNAFATGRNPQNASVAATTGLLNMLNQDEIAGVMAHELAHVKNRDTLTMTITATIAGAIGLLANFALFFRGGRDNPLGLVGGACDDDPGAARCNDGSNGDLANPRIRGRQGRRRDLRPPAVARLGAREDAKCGAANRQCRGGEQSGDRPYVHHQPPACPLGRQRRRHLSP